MGGRISRVCLGILRFKSVAGGHCTFVHFGRDCLFLFGFIGFGQRLGYVMLRFNGLQWFLLSNGAPADGFTGLTGEGWSALLHQQVQVRYSARYLGYRAETITAKLITGFRYSVSGHCTDKSQSVRSTSFVQPGYVWLLNLFRVQGSYISSGEYLDFNGLNVSIKIIVYGGALCTSIAW